ncbi:hypothetical protein ACFLV7_10115 [Chloroflexota bacterium]
MRKIRIKFLLAGSTIIVVLLGLFVIAPMFFGSRAQSPRDSILIGAVPPTEGMASFVDKDSGETYGFRLIAIEEDISGDAKVTLLLDGPSLKLCTANGTTADIYFDGVEQGSDPYDYDYPGNIPLAAIACGTAHYMAVSIDGCQADIEFHGYVHSDYPLVTYMGMVTTDVEVQFGGGPENKKVDIKIYTPNETIKLKGKIDGDAVMSTCP